MAIPAEHRYAMGPVRDTGPPRTPELLQPCIRADRPEDIEYHEATENNPRRPRHYLYIHYTHGKIDMSRGVDESNLKLDFRQPPSPWSYVETLGLAGIIFRWLHTPRHASAYLEYSAGRPRSRDELTSDDRPVIRESGVRDHEKRCGGLNAADWNDGRQPYKIIMTISRTIKIHSRTH